MIGIINYKAGNSKSVLNTCNYLGLNAKLISQPSDFYDVDRIILPGVGSAEETMKSLTELNVLETLNNRVLCNKVPFLGICVGLQVLFQHSDEGNVDCLGYLKGKVVKFDSSKKRVPQIGWNQINLKKISKLVDNSLDKSYLYFVNSYYCIPEDSKDILAITDYEGEFTSMVEKDNIFGSQCHIEKSGKVGLQILKSFSELQL